jgi:ammonium transporter, Amt family
MAIGIFILWIGWFGFNGGNALSISDPFESQIFGRILVNTSLSSTMACLTALTFQYIMTSVYCFKDCLHGILAGLVSITAGCSVLEPYSAIISGFIGALVYLGWCKMMDIMLLDDCVDAVAVHGACGIWGLIAAALLAYEPFTKEVYGFDIPTSSAKGLLYGGDGRLLGNALILVVCIIAWVGTAVFILFFMLRNANVLRVSEVNERRGMDQSYHGGRAYQVHFHHEVKNISDISIPRHTSSGSPYMEPMTPLESESLGKISVEANTI